jgi:hypothetical protein
MEKITAIAQMMPWKEIHSDGVSFHTQSQKYRKQHLIQKFHLFITYLRVKFYSEPKTNKKCLYIEVFKKIYFTIHKFYNSIYLSSYILLQKICMILGQYCYDLYRTFLRTAVCLKIILINRICHVLISRLVPWTVHEYLVQFHGQVSM